MRTFFRVLILIGIMNGLAAASPPPAAEPSGERVDEFEQIEEGDDAAASQPEPESEPVVQPQKKAGKGSASGKDAEGSKAPNRFQAEFVTKSNYKLNGESLEVDPD